MTKTSAMLIGFNGKEYTRHIARRIVGDIDSKSLISLPLQASCSPTRGRIHVPTNFLYEAGSIALAFPRTEPQPLDADLLRKFRNHKLLALRAIDRIRPVATSHRDSEEYINCLLRYWLGFLDQIGPTHAIFASVPHFPWDLVLDFALLQYSVPRYYLHETALDRVSFFAASTSCAVGSSSVRFSSEDPFIAQFDEFSPEILRNSKKLVGSRSQNAQLSRPSIKNLLRHITIATCRHLGGFLLAGARPPWQEYFGLSLPKFVRLQLKHFAQLRAAYDWFAQNSINSEELDTKPFVLFALHMQPERTTDPEAGDMSLQIVAIEMIARAVHPWGRVIVKEHPAQFNPQTDLRKLHYRGIDFYERVLAIEGVGLAPLHSDPSELARYSFAVASCRGSILWEALLDGIPSISFAKTWHDTVPFSPICKTVADVTDALLRFRDVRRDQVLASVETFLRSQSGMLIRGAPSHKQWLNTGRNRDDIENIVMAIRKLIANVD